MAKQHAAPLAVTVEDGALVVRIGAHVLANACAYSEWANPWDEQAQDYVRTFAVSDPVQLAADVRHAMEDEREDGSTPLSDFLDAMTQAALDDGSEGIECDQRIRTGEFAPSETWAAIRPALPTEDQEP